MPTTYAEFDSTPANLVADLRSRILASTDWAEIGGAGSNLLKATTTRGAQMVVDLDDAAVTAQRAQVAAYRSHDGTTGVDPVVRYLPWRATGGATTDPLHCVVSAGKEHLYVSVEGPRGGEPNAENATAGSARASFALVDVVPYFDSTVDPVPTVCLIAHLPSGIGLTHDCWVSRNASNTSSWVPARLGSVTPPSANGAPPANYATGLQTRRPDGTRFAWPYVVSEMSDGPRGRLNVIYFAGQSTSGVTGDSLPQVGERLTVGGVATILTMPVEGTSGAHHSNAFGAVNNSGNAVGNPVIAIPVG